MNETLKTILDMDKKAQQKVAEAEEYRKNAVASLSAKKNAVIEDETRMAKESALRRSERRRAVEGKNLSAVKEKNVKILEKLEKLYTENADSWVDEIVANVTK